MKILKELIETDKMENLILSVMMKTDKLWTLNDLQKIYDESMN